MPEHANPAADIRPKAELTATNKAMAVVHYDVIEVTPSGQALYAVMRCNSLGSDFFACVVLASETLQTPPRFTPIFLDG